jgi:hypothetical protein
VKATYASLAEIPAAVVSEYEEKDGKYVLKVEGEHPVLVSPQKYNELNGKFVAFRDTNNKLLSALGASGLDQIDVALARAAAVAGIDPAKLAKMKDVDPDEYAALKAAALKLKEKGVKDPEDIDARIASAVKAALDPVLTNLEAEKQRSAKAQAAADEGIIRHAVADRFLKAGGNAEAVDFIVSEFKKGFRIVEDNGQRVVRANPDVFSADRPGTPLTEEEWLAGATKRFGFAFAPSGGGGANPSSGGNKPSSPQRPPNSIILKNPTPQELGQYSGRIGKDVFIEPTAE